LTATATATVRARRLCHHGALGRYNADDFDIEK